jgi:hypothetical protein
VPLVMASTRHMRARELKGEERQLSSRLASRRIHGGSCTALHPTNPGDHARASSDSVGSGKPHITSFGQAERDESRPGICTGWAGSMFTLRWKTLFGSYLALIAARRSYLCPYVSRTLSPFLFLQSVDIDRGADHVGLQVVPH